MKQETNNYSEYSALLKYNYIACIVGIIYTGLVTAFLYGFRNFGAAPELTMFERTVEFFAFFGPLLLLTINFVISLEWKLTGGIIYIVLSLAIIAYILILEHGPGTNYIFLISAPVDVLFLVSGIFFIKIHRNKSNRINKDHDE
ncbi:DUF7670 domain-containing protein [Maribellus sediminis]|uniref:DUF7670 domain-containing protein n=1 Tax=Maribellus sediminis TaxID=2696285 RepID=UPI001430B50B|nr:hypothetical protein [Maribellus sediminis]